MLKDLLGIKPVVTTHAIIKETVKTTVAKTDEGNDKQGEDSTLKKLQDQAGTTGKVKPIPNAGLGNSTSKVSSGTKATTINIHIGALIKSFSISTTNIEESTSKVQEMVTRVLLSAVNDSQLVVGQ